MTDESYAAFKVKTQALMDRNNEFIPTGPYNFHDELQWAQDSYEIAKTLYDGVTENEAVP